MKKLLLSIALLLIMNCGSELDPVGQANEKKEKEEKAKTKGLLIALVCESNRESFKHAYEVNPTNSLTYISCMGKALNAYSGID